jgi:alpha-L-fucosidase
VIDNTYFEKDAATLATEVIDDACSGWWREAQETKEERLSWWREARFGCFAHWGPYAVLAGNWQGDTSCGYSEHIQRAYELTQETYRIHAVEKFNPTAFDADAWIRLLHEAGIRHFAITAKHHDGFAMWDSQVSDYTIVKATPYGRDPMPALKAACDKYRLRFGFYYSHAFDWGDEFGPGNDWEYENPGGNRHIKGNHHWWDAAPELRRPIVEKYVNRKSIPQILELIDGYDPDFLWFDTDHKLPFHENMRILEAIRQAKPSILVNGRLVNTMTRNFGDYHNTGDRAGEFYMREGDWESVPCTNESYGYHAYDKSHKPVSFFVQLLAKAVSRSGNILLNLGPKADGTIDQADVAIFEGIGRWMRRHDQSIYGCRRSTLPLQEWGVTTAKGDTVYCHVFDWPRDAELIVAGLPNDPQTVTLAETNTSLDWHRINATDIAVRIPPDLRDESNTVVALGFDTEPSSDSVRLFTGTQPLRLLAFDAERYARRSDDSMEAEADTQSEVKGELFGRGMRNFSQTKSNTDVLEGDDSDLTYGDGKVVIPNYFVRDWRSTDQWLEWTVRLEEPMTITVELTYTGGSSQGGGRYRLTAGDHAIDKEAVLTKEPHRDTFGPIPLPAGAVTVKLEALEIHGNELMRPLAVVLRNER